MTRGGFNLDNQALGPIGKNNFQNTVQFKEKFPWAEIWQGFEDATKDKERVDYID